MKTLVAMLSLTLLACGEAALPPIETPDFTTSGGCSDDSQCSAPTPRCNKNSAKCVACLPDNDNCPKGERCVPSNGSFACSASCLVDADCPKSDAGNPTSCCSGACVDTRADTLSCGRCGAVCPTPQNGTAGCSGGVCGIGTCNQGFLDCDRASNNGCEINTSNDDRNCGACGKVCTANANQSFACTDGKCTTACNAGFADCDGNPANGCEVATQTDSGNCGACGTVCKLDNASSVCKAGVCVVDACSAGFDDCNADPKDGCESDLSQDLNHCGNCIKTCVVANGSSVCRMGSCIIASCNAGFSDCDSLYLTGCEVANQADPKNCGSCGTKCQGANSMQACQMGVCQITMCTQDYSDCDKKSGTGCEVNIASDVMNCGACGSACPVPANAAAACTNGKCVVGQCKFGFLDCNKDPLDGCETDIQAVQNCGMCGAACQAPPNATAGCKVGVCGVGVCNVLFGDCDGNGQNGCEKNLSTDAMNCGKCGAVCNFANAQGACLGGQCGIVACNQGFADCDKDPANGCEVAINTDPSNCGKCGTVCPQNLPACQSGACSPATCLNNPQWTPVICVNPSWDWSMNRNIATMRPQANALRVLASQFMNNGMCSIDGKGYVSTKSFTISNCNTLWYHLGGSFTGNCGGHDNELYRLLVLSENDCYAY